MGQEKYAGTTKKVNGLPVWTGKINLVEDAISIPLRRKNPTTWFVNSMSDLFHEDVPDDFILRVFDVMRICTWAGGQNCGKIRGSGHTFQVLTKRAERMADFGSRLRWDGERLFLGETGGQHMLRLNRQIWMGVSCEDQQRADERIPHLLRCPAAVRFLSCEPLLGSVNLSLSLAASAKSTNTAQWRTAWRGFIDWVIVGGESGPGARPCTIGHIRSLVRQCQAAGAACFVKQLGAKPVNREGVAHPLKDPKGGDMAEWPEDLRVREFPGLEHS